METTIIKIGDADKGGYWFEACGDAADETNFFEDGFATAWEAAQAAMERFPRYEIYYRSWCESAGRFVSIPGEVAA
jgi:hypothetical protein